MTITYIQQDLLKVTHGVIAHGCNCQGKMGAGLAKLVKAKWPAVFYTYLDKCFSTTNKRSLLGHAQIIPVVSESITYLYVANMFTQETYGRGPGIRYADPAAIETSLSRVVKFCDDNEYPLYIPKIGCSLGGLNWEIDVEPIVRMLDNEHNILIYVCEK